MEVQSINDPLLEINDVDIQHFQAWSIVEETLIAYVNHKPFDSKLFEEKSCLLFDPTSCQDPNFIIDTYFNLLRAALRKEIDSKLQSLFSSYDEIKSQAEEEDSKITELRWVDQTFFRAIKSLHECFSYHFYVVKTWNTLVDPVFKLTDRFLNDFQTVTFLSIPAHFMDVSVTYFRNQFINFHNSRKDQLSNFKPEDLMEGDDDEDDDDEEEDEDDQEEWFECEIRIGEVSKMLIEMGWLILIDDSCTQTLRNQIDIRVTKTCEDITGRSLPKLEYWFELIVTSWINELFKKEELNNAYITPSLRENISTLTENWQKRLNYHLYESFGLSSIPKMFSLLADYPDSEMSILSIRKCLETTRQHSFLVKSLVEQFKNRLLIPGAATNVIIGLYINTIRAMKLVDPSTILLESISKPIKEYLRQRKDTLRCVINSLNEDGELFNQMGKAYAKQSTKQIEDYNNISSDEDEEAAEKWEPNPIEAQSSGIIGYRNKQSDIISNLINIYDSQDGFIEEYTLVLSERLLKITDFSIEEELKRLELLKLRFGESSLSKSDIMIRDMSESKRINKVISEKMKAEDIDTDAMLSLDKVSCTILSKAFWPVTENSSAEKFKLPDRLAGSINRYQELYTNQKQSRSLEYYHNLGVVTLTLEFENDTLQLQVTPIQAAIISFFDDREDGITAEELANELEMTVRELKLKISFWVGKGIIQEVRSKSARPNLMGNENIIVYKAAKTLDKSAFSDESGTALSHDEGRPGDSEEDRKLREGLVMTMLNTAGPKSLTQIQFLLKTKYITEKAYNKTEQETYEMLDSMVKRGALIYNGEVYSLDK